MYINKVSCESFFFDNFAKYEKSEIDIGCCVYGDNRKIKKNNKTLIRKRRKQKLNGKQKKENRKG